MTTHVSRRSLLAGASALGVAATLGTPAAHATAAPGKFVAWFVDPRGWNTQAEMEAALRTIRTDVVIMGARLSPVAKVSTNTTWTSMPAQVKSAIGSRRVYYYGGEFIFNNAYKPGAVTVYTVGTWRWSVWLMGTGDAVVFKAPTTRFDKVTMMCLAGQKVGAKVVPGIPRPALRTDKTHLPDMSYKAVLATFVGYWAKDMVSRGADGFYQGFEMVSSTSSEWTPVLDLYRSQHAAIAAKVPGANVLVSPYIQGNKTMTVYKSVAETAAGLKLIAGTGAGTTLWVSPQDGMGTDSQAPSWEPHSNWVATLEQYLAAGRAAVGTRFYVTTEAFRNNRATSYATNRTDRIPTTLSRISSQLWTEKNYSRGSIGYMWNDRVPGREALSASRIPGISTFSAGFGHLFS